MNQQNRDKILIEMDEKGIIDNKDLFMYELTPYYSLDNNTESFFDKILIYNNQCNRMTYDNAISFTPSQKKIFEEISTPGRYAISATTSFGKTSLIKEYIKRFLPKIVVYIVPTNSLADELLTSFEELFESDHYEVIDTSVSSEIPDLSKPLIFVGTQEKLIDIKWLKQEKVNLFVIDEAYKLNDKINGLREISLNRSFIDFLNISDNFILLLPLVNNIEGLENFNIKLLKTDYSPVTKVFKEIDDDLFYSTVRDKIKTNNEKSLVYFSSPQSIEKFYWSNDLNSIDSNLSDDWIERVEKDFHKDWLPVISYKKGIAIHNGNMPKFIQMRMVKMFNNSSSFNTILSTSSLIEGVNTPTKNIYIMDNNIYREKDIIKYKNLIGRAGRLKVCPVGKIFYNKKDDRLIKKVNSDWRNINLKLIVSDNETLADINRGEVSNEMINFSKDYDIPIDKVNEYLETTGMTIKQLKIMIKNLKDYDSECKKSFYPSYTTDLYFFYIRCSYNPGEIFKNSISLRKKSDINYLRSISEGKESILKDQNFEKKLTAQFIKTLLSSTINPTICKKRMYDIPSMVQYIDDNVELKFFDCNNSTIVSSVIRMIYSFLPYELIPFLENIILLNTIFNEANINLVDEKIIIYINEQLRKYNTKYFGKIDCDDKERKIIRRLFEYGVPYLAIKDDISYLVEKVGDNFSIIHIKKAINENKNLSEKLSKYFE